MISLKRLSLLMLPAILLLLVAACGDDPTATPRPTATSAPPEPTATPEPAPDPTATPTTAPAATATPEPEAPGGPVTYTFGDFVVEDGKFELRMGETAYFGYDAEQRIPTIAGLIEIVFGPIQVGDTLSFARCRQSGSRSTKEHRLTVDLFGLDHNLYGDTGGGAIGDSDDTSNNCEFTFNEPGEFIFYDSTDPDDHGVAKVIVEGEAMAGGPTTYTFGDFVVEDGKFELRMGATAYFGYDAEQRIPTIPGLIEIVFGPIQVGDTISFARCRQSGSRSTVTHHLTLDVLGFDAVLDDGRFGADPPGGAVGDSDDTSNNCEFTFNEPGEFLFYDSTDPDGHGVAKVIVEGEAMAGGPTTWLMDQFVVEDGKYELRMGDTAMFGYDAEQRVPTIAGLIEIVFGPIQVGDTVVFGRCRQSGSRSTKEHRLTVEKLGLDHNLFGDTGGGSIGDSDDPDNNCVFGPFTEPGEYIIDDSTDPGEHGVAKFVVEGEAVMAAGVTWTIDRWSVEDGIIDMRMSDEGYWGYSAGQRDITDWTITVNVGDTLDILTFARSGSRSTIDHHITIEGLGIDEANPDRDAGTYSITFDTPGTFLVDDILDPGEHGVNTIIVLGDTMMAEPVVYTLDEIRVRDTVFELRMGDEALWGYDAGLRVRTDEVGDITISINVGDTLVFPDGLTGSGSATETHFITIDEFGIDAEIAPGADTNLGLEITPTQAGTFRLYCSAHPDPAVHGNFFIVVS
ncbi:MAG: hypothetical protein IH869_03855 [Chloroflexi bacterium]|nr:hypothetical protein [Chloroflexota bacterium]